MKLLRQRDIPEENYANAFLGFGPEESNFTVELTYSKLSFMDSSHICEVFEIPVAFLWWLKFNCLSIKFLKIIGWGI